MSKIRYAVTRDDAGWRFDLIRRQGILFAKDEVLAFADWPKAARSHPGVALLLSLMDSEEAQRDGEAIRLPHATVAGLSRAETIQIGLPPMAPFTLFLSHDAPIGDIGFALRIEWFQRDGSPLFGLQRQGTALTVGTKPYLILDPLYSALEAIVAVNAASGDASPEGLDRRMVAYADFKQHLTRLTGDLRADDYLRGLTIHHATGLGIDLEPGSDTAPFLPTLYGDQPVDATTAENEDREPIREPLLPQHQADRFQERFVGQGARRHFTLGNGVYTILDAPVAAALEVLVRVNHADAATRQAFRADPLSFLTPALEAAGSDGGIICDLRGYGERVSGYGERVIGVGPWVPPKLSFPLAVSRDWFPDEEVEVFTIAIPGEAPLVIRGEEIDRLQDQVTQAQQSGATLCDFNGRDLSLTNDLVTTIQGLAGRITSPAPKQTTPDESSATPRQAAITQDNEELLTFLAERQQQRCNASVGLPASLRTTPKPHQESGIAWLQAGYLAGAPGLLLADDMGLGKTYQVLAFLRWLRDTRPSHARTREPFLVVAPKTLLGNWIEELEFHLGAGALGQELRVFEKGLAALKRIQAKGNDTTLGQQTLDVARIENADFVLTTYETLRDYHLSFGKVRFAVIVYDEAQKLKNPTSLMNRGAKAQQGQFVLAMTGTPIENSVLDLWTLLDIAWPGFLALSAKDFLKQYGNQDLAARERLKQRLIEPSQGPDQRSDIPPILLRRFKQDTLEGLPTRRVEAPQALMPPVQQLAYDAIRTAIRTQARSALEGLQQLRAISLHPQLGQRPESAQEDANFIAASARFTLLFQILDQIHAHREKALIFVELREAQRALYDLIQRRYQLTAPQPETINGATVAQVRDRIRRDFQQRPGFDVLILGPKAAGFGLTLTAANHVVHLNRWWNPAVEDQCSDRVYRIGATKPVTIYLPQAIHPELGEQSFDSLLHALLEEKRSLSREIVVPVQFNDRDFRRLFERSLGEGETNVSAHLDGMDWREFECWVAEELKHVGFSIKITSGQGDGGVDVIGITPDSRGRALFIQCKHTGHGAAGAVGEQGVLDLLRARIKHSHIDANPILIAVTNGRFSLKAEHLAQEHGVKLFDSFQLLALGHKLADLSRTLRA
ncbi:SNF2-related protein [Thiocystis violacea]|uniref:SNF2-related protein n=1 Tax=Thiocystis violacea TaxID=13725 RepID=UPI001904363D|nr:SNF2-related protein [Thiocystis violacea]MBK1720138.1 hypothetical protein [Thiocystis violacea]